MEYRDDILYFLEANVNNRGEGSIVISVLSYSEIPLLGDNGIKLDHVSFHILSNSLVTDHPTIRRYINSV
jgi:hypothetical protein